MIFEMKLVLMAALFALFLCIDYYLIKKELYSEVENLKDDVDKQRARTRIMKLAVEDLANKFDQGNMNDVKDYLTRRIDELSCDINEMKASRRRRPRPKVVNTQKEEAIVGAKKDSEYKTVNTKEMKAFFYEPKEKAVVSDNKDEV